jgi:hypothetical protein
MSMNPSQPHETPLSTVRTVYLTITQAAITRFYPLLQAGFSLPCQVSVSLSTFLQNTLGLSEQYIEERISTVFLDGKPVDDMEDTIIENGATLALSSAMPGLVGATMRRKGFYASLRSTITYQNKVSTATHKAGSIRLKLFNIIMTDLGPAILERGIRVFSRNLDEFFRSQDSQFFEAILEVRIDGRSVDPAALRREDGETPAEWTEIKTCVSK